MIIIAAWVIIIVFFAVVFLVIAHIFSARDAIKIYLVAFAASTLLTWAARTISP